MELKKVKGPSQSLPAPVTDMVKMCRPGKCPCGGPNVFGFHDHTCLKVSCGLGLHGDLGTVAVHTWGQVHG